MKKFLIAILTSNDIDILKLTIQSAIGQTYTNYDIYVVVNSLNKHYFNLVQDMINENYKDNISKVIETESNGKPGKGHNSLLSLIKDEPYEYLLSCDGDDFLYPIALTRIEDILKEPYDAIALCGSSPKLEMHKYNCKEIRNSNNRNVEYKWSRKITIDKCSYNNICKEYNHILATPCRLLIIKKSFAIQQSTLFDERMYVYDDYSMFLTLYSYYISKQYSICFLSDPYLYIYNYTNPFSVSHIDNDSKIPNTNNDVNIYNTYDISSLDVRNINITLHNSLTLYESKVIQEYDTHINLLYRSYYDKKLYAMVSVSLDKFHLKNILFYDKGGIEWDSKTIQERSLRGTESAIYQLANTISSLNLNETIVLTKGGKLDRIKNNLEFNSIDCITQYNPEVVIYQGFIYNETLFKDKIQLLYMHHDITIDFIKKYFSNIKNIDATINGYIFVSHWQKNRFIQYYQLNPEKCHVIQNAIHPMIDYKCKTMHKTPTIIFVSSPYRGLIPLLTLFDLILSTFPNITLKVFSSFSIENTSQRNYIPITMDFLESISISSLDKHYLPIYKHMIQHKHIDYYGNVPQHVLFNHMQESMIYVYPCSFPETCCTSVLEAMAHRCFVVSSDIGALRETTNNMAYLYDPCIDVNHNEITVESHVANPIQLPAFSKIYIRSMLTKINELLTEYNLDEKQRYLDKQQEYIENHATWHSKSRELMDIIGLFDN